MKDGASVHQIAESDGAFWSLREAAPLPVIGFAGEYLRTIAITFPPWSRRSVFREPE